MKMRPILYLLTIFLLPACSDPCADINCVNGDCDDGICICEEGYEGSDCDEQIRSKYYGIYSADVTPCIPPVFQNLPEVEQLKEFLDPTLIAGPGQTVTELNLNAASPLLNFNQDVDITSGSFIIPETITEIDDPGIPLAPFTLTSSGLGQLLSQDSIKMDIILTIESEQSPLPFSQNCTLLFIKS